MVNYYMDMPYRSYGHSYADDAGLILGIYGVIIVVFLLGALVHYLIKGFGLYGIAKKRNNEHAWMAFVPYANAYLQGELAGEVTLGKKKVENWGIWTLLAPLIFGALFVGVYIVLWVLIVVGIIGSAANLASVVLVFALLFMLLFILVLVAGEAGVKAVYGIACYQIYKRYTAGTLALVHTILGIFIPFYQAIYFFILRNREPLEPPAATTGADPYLEQIPKVEPPDQTQPEQMEAPVPEHREPAQEPDLPADGEQEEHDAQE